MKPSKPPVFKHALHPCGEGDLRLYIDNVTPEDWATFVMPSNITHLEIYGDFLDVLHVPEGVQFVHADHLSLRHITLPDSVTWLNAEHNCLRTVVLPTNIEYVDLHHNFLTEMSFRGPPNVLGMLNVAGNQLSSLNFEVTDRLYGFLYHINPPLSVTKMSKSLRAYVATTDIGEGYCEDKVCGDCVKK